MIGVTFNIRYDDTYSDRYQKLYEVFRRFGIKIDRTTSCVFLNTEESDKVHTALYGALDYKKDKAIVFTTYEHTLQHFGPA